MRNRIRSHFIPAIVMLSAAAIDVIISMIQHLPLLDFLERLLIVMLIFLFIGWVIRLILDKCISIMSDKKEETDKEQMSTKAETSEAENDNTAKTK